MGSRVKIIAVVMIASAVMASCGSETRFKVAERFPGGCVYVDRETGIGYGHLYDQYGVFPMLDAEGNAYRPNGWRDYGE